jgi:predicted CxxxxCH...CXXCH cytochrome family protein
VDKVINLGFTGTNATGTAYSKGIAFAPGAVYGSCSTSKCHGSGTVSWGGTLWSTTDQCAKCHSSSAAGAVTAAAPFYSTSFPTRVTVATDVKVGAHTSHLISADSLSAALNCNACHGTVALNSTTHMNGSTSFSWSALATANGALTPTYSTATGVCSNVYCHGAAMPGGDTSGTNRAPVWNVAFLPATLSVASCNTCHGFPPSAAFGHPSVTIPAGFPATASIGTTCSCHANINPSGNSYATIFVDKSLHINGSAEVIAGGACDACHGYPPASVAFVGTANNWSGAKAENYAGGGGAHTINNHVSKLAIASDGFANCVKCHDAADHQMSPIVFNPNQNIKVKLSQRFRMEAAKQTRYSSNRLNGASHLTGTCSNSSCHFGATPKWDPSH